MLRVLPAAVLAALISAAPASAATFHVDPAGTYPTIKSAVTAARATDEADTITIAPGVYEESVELLDAKDAGLTVVGAGDGADPATATIIRAGINRYTVFSAWHPVTLRGVRLEHPGTPDDDGDRRAAGANLYGAGSLVEDVTVDLETDEPQDWGFDVRDGAFTLRDVHVDAGGGLGIYAQEGVLTVEDSTLRGEGGGFEDRSSGPAARATLRRVRVTTTADAEAAVRAQAPLTVDSSLITGGWTGIDLRNGDGDGTELLLRTSTLDPGVHGPDTATTPEGAPIHAISLGGGQGLVDSSIVFGALGSWDDVAGELRCEYSAVTATVKERTPGAQGAVACPDTAQGNIAVSAALIGADHVLAADAAARDTGRPGALPEGAPATDLAGRPRIATAPGGCAGRVDMGAFESDARACPPAPDPGTCTSAAPPCVPADPATDRTAPRIAKLSRKRARLRGTLSERATVRVTIARCKPAKRGAAKRCVTIARRTRALDAGRFALVLPRKARKAGHYRVAVIATDAAGNVAAARLRYRVKR